MKPKTMVFLLVLLAACVIFIALRSSYRGESKNEAPITAPSVFDPPPIGARQLVITSADGSKKTFVKEGKDWQVIEPIKAKANNARLDDLANSLIDLRVAAGQDETLDNEVTGLDKPAWTVALTDGSGKVYTLYVGQPVPMGPAGRTFVRPEGGKAVVAALDLKVKLDQPINDFRDKALWDVNSASVNRIRVQGRDSYDLVRDGEDWKIVARNLTANADQEKARLIAEKLIGLNVEEFADDQPASLASYGLDNPSLILGLEVNGGAAEMSPSTKASSAPASQPVKDFSLVIGATSGKNVFAKLGDKPGVFLLNRIVPEALAPRIMDIRDKNFVHLEDVQEVAGVDIQLPSGKVILAREQGQWRMKEPFAGKADEEAVKELISKITNLKAEAFEGSPLSNTAYGLDKPAATITLNLHNRKATLTVGAKTPTGEMVYVKGSDNQAVGVIKNVEATPLLAEAPSYWNRILLDLTAAEKPSELAIDRGDISFVIGRDKTDRWQLISPITAKSDYTAIDNNMTMLFTIKANKVVAVGPKLPSTYADAPGKVTVKLSTVSTSEAASRPTSRLAAKSYVIHAVKIGETAYAWVDGMPLVVVGEMPPKFYQSLTAELRLHDFGIPDTTIARRIRVNSGKEKVDILNDARQWRDATDRHLVLNALKVEEYLALMRLIRLERFVTYLPPARLAQYGLDKPAIEVEIVLAIGEPFRISVSATGPGNDNSRYAIANNTEGVMVLSASTVSGLKWSLNDFKGGNDASTPQEDAGGH